MPSTAGRIINRRTALKQAAIVGTFTIGAGSAAATPGKANPEAGGLLLVEGKPPTDVDFFILNRTDEPPSFPTGCRASGRSGTRQGYDRIYIEYDYPPPGGFGDYCAIHENKPLPEGWDSDYRFVNPRPCSEEDNVWMANFRPV